MSQFTEENLGSPELRHHQWRITDWIERALFINGAPFRFSDRPYLYRPYDTHTPSRIMKCGRATEKSTFLCNLQVAFAANYPLFKVLYASASQKQATDFSRDQLKSRLLSPWIRQRHFNPKFCDDNIEYKEFSNGSSIRLRHMYHTPDRIRGIRSDLLEIDEIQDIETRFIPIIQECLTGSAWRTSIYSGTPKTFDNPIEFYWENSTMEEWEVKCPHCGRWQEGGLDINNIGKRGPICRYCGGYVDVKLGQWISYGDNKDRLGFRIPQLIIPYFQDEENWRTKILENLSTYSQGQFKNEVLGLSYDQSEKPITEADIRKCCTFNGEPGAWITRRTGIIAPSIPVFMGVDWGTGGASKTAYVIGGFVDEHLFQVYTARIYAPTDFNSPDELLDDIARVANQWDCRAVGSDWGFGCFENIRLRPKIGDDRLWEFQNVGQQRQVIKWNAQAGRFTHNTTSTMSDLFAAIKDQRFIFPDWDRWKDYAAQFLNVTREYNVATGHVSYRNRPDRPDDVAHALNYAWMAGRLIIQRWLQRNVRDKSSVAESMPIPHFLR